jgi:hypothetical protein
LLSSLSDGLGSSAEKQAKVDVQILPGFSREGFSFPKLHKAHPSMPNDVLAIVSMVVWSSMTPVVSNMCDS